MKYLLTISILLLSLTACNKEANPKTDSIPTDLAGKKAYLKERKEELRTLNRKIAKVEAEIGELVPATEKARKLVDTMLVPTKDFKRFVEIQAVVQSDDMVVASSETGGRILQLQVKEGQAVKKGQLIARIDLEQIDKQAAELNKALELATDLYERQGRLWKQNIGSEVQYLQAKNNKERIEASLETIGFQKTKANVYAPISGVVEQEFLKAGELAAPGMPIVQILNTAKIKVVASVPETYLGKIKKGAMVDIKFPALDKTTRAKVTQLGRTINPGNRTFEIEVAMANKGGLLKPNLLALMLVNDFSIDNAVVIPIEIVQQEVSGKRFVFLKEDGPDGAIAKKVYVETGETYEGEMVITKGLQGGESLITDGGRGLTDGQLVKN